MSATWTYRPIQTAGYQGFHSHRIDMDNTYIVVQTRRGYGRDIVRTGDYQTALIEATELRRAGNALDNEWAVIDIEYPCGCRGSL